MLPASKKIQIIKALTLLTIFVFPIFSHAEPMISAGDNYSLFVNTEGEVWGWGRNKEGQLGDGSREQRNKPVQALGLPKITYISAGQRHSIAVDTDGQVWSWGDNRFGKLGNGTTQRTLSPISITGLPKIQKISAGASHSLALDINGNLWAWGSNGYGQIGNGQYNPNVEQNPDAVVELVPTKLSSLSNVIDISAGGVYSLAITSDGKVWAWGFNDVGTLGIGTTKPKYLPTYTGLSNIQNISAGNWHSLVVSSSGSVWAWGSNNSARLGTGDTEARLSPYELGSKWQGVPNAIAVATGTTHSLALQNNGQVWAWGSRSRGQLGDWQTSTQSIPIEVVGMANVVSISAGEYHSLALKADGTVWAWGGNNYGQIGHDMAEDPQRNPMQIDLAIQQADTEAPQGNITGVNSQYMFNVGGNNPDIPFILTAFDNIELSKIYFEITGRDGTLTNIPVWNVTEKSVSQEISFPLPDQEGHYTARLLVTDAAGLQTEFTKSFTVTVDNQLGLTISGIQSQYHKITSNTQDVQHTINYELGVENAENLVTMHFSLLDSDNNIYASKNWTISSASNVTKTGSVTLPVPPQAYTAKLSVTDSSGAVAEKTQQFSTSITSTSATPIGQIIGIKSLYPYVSGTPSEEVECKIIGLDDKNLSTIDFAINSIDGDGVFAKRWNVSGTYVEKIVEFTAPGLIKTFIAELTLTDTEGNKEYVTHNFDVTDKSALHISRLAAHQNDDQDLEVSFDAFNNKNSRLEAAIFIDEDSIPFRYKPVPVGSNDYLLSLKDLERKLSGNNNTHLIRVELRDLDDSSRTPAKQQTYFDFSVPPPVVNTSSTVKNELSVTGLSAIQSIDGDLQLRFKALSPMHHTMQAYVYLNNSSTAFGPYHIRSGHEFDTRLAQFNVANDVYETGEHTLKLELLDKETKLSLIEHTRFHFDVQDAPIVTGDNQPPRFLGGNAKPRSISQGGSITLETIWDDPEDQKLYSPTVRYRKKGTTTWYSPSKRLDYVPYSNPPRFNITFGITKASGEYEFQGRIWDDATAQPTEWIDAGNFIVDLPPSGVEMRRPQLHVQQAPVFYVEPGESIALKLYPTDENRDVTAIHVNWNDNGSPVDEKNASHNTTATFYHTYNQKGAYTITARAYDATNARSQELKWLVFVGVRPVVGTSGNSVNIGGQNYPSITTAQVSSQVNQCIENPDSFGKGDPVDTASGTQELTYTLMQVLGIQPIALTLSYNSLLLADGVAGKGWDIKFLNAFLQEDTQGDVKVYWSPNTYNHFMHQTDGSYASVEIACQFDTLEKNANGGYTLTRKNRSIYQFNADGNLISLRDSKNRELEFTYDSEYRLTQVTEPHSSVYLIYEYNQAGLLSTVSDPLNRRTRLYYDTQKHLVAITNPVGDTTRYSYNEFGQIVSAINNDEETLFTNTFDEHGRIIAQDDAIDSNRLIEFDYDETSIPGKLITTVKNRDGSTSTYVYNSNYQVEVIKDSFGFETKISYDDKGRRVSSTDANDNTTSYGYDEQGNLTTITGPDQKVIRRMEYNARRNLLSVTDANDNSTRFEYDDNNNRVKKIDANDNVTRYTYNAQQQLEGIIYPNEGVERRYYEKGRLSQITNSLEQHRYLKYDTAGRLIKMIDENGTVTETHYDAMDRIIAKIDPLENITRIAYTARDKVQTVQQPNSGIVHNQYNAEGWLISSIDAENRETLYSHDGEGQITAITNPRRETTQVEHNQRGEPVKTISPSGREIQKIYDPVGNLIKTLNHFGDVIERIEYDVYNRPVRVYDAKDNVIEYRYDLNGNVTTIIDQFKNPVYIEYDKHNRVTKITDARGHSSYLEYDVSGNLVKEIDVLENTTRYEYNLLNQLVKIIDARGHITRLEYDLVGNLTSTIDPLDNSNRLVYNQGRQLVARIDALDNAVEKLRYNALGQVAEKINALDHSTAYEHDLQGDLVKITDPLQRLTQLQRDELGRLSTSIDALQGYSRQVFDQDGQRTGFTDPNENSTRFVFDQLGRLSQEFMPWSSDNSKDYTYNLRDLVESITNLREQETAFEHDAAGRVLKVSDEAGYIRYHHDKNGNITRIESAEGSLYYEFDALNRMSKYTDLFGDSLHYAYDEVGNLITLIYPGNKAVHYEYDAANRMTKVIDWAKRETRYEYDANGHLLKQQRPNGTYQTRSYNIAGQLTQQQDFYPDGSLLVQYDYRYDAAGNIVEEISLPEMPDFALSQPMMTYASGNRLVTFNDESVNFDADGNMLYGPVFDDLGNYVFDVRNRLHSVNGVEYVYDAENKRIATTANGQETRYLVNPQPALSQTLRRTKANAETTWYIYGAQGLIGEENNGVYQAYHFDYRGSTVALTNAQGELTQAFQYSPFAVLVSQHPVEVDTPFLYNGRDGVMTDDNGLYYMRARYYSPLARRFVNQDVLLGFVDDSQSLNRFAYVTGQPVSLIDPFGLEKTESEGSEFFSPNEFDLGSGFYQFGGETAEIIYKYEPGAGSTFKKVGNTIQYLGAGKNIYDAYQDEGVNKMVEQTLIESAKIGGGYVGGVACTPAPLLIPVCSYVAGEVSGICMNAMIQMSSNPETRALFVKELTPPDPQFGTLVTDDLSEGYVNTNYPWSY